MKVAVAASGLGHITRGIEAWASDLALSLDARGVDVRLYKGSGSAESPRERVVPCVRRDAALARLAARPAASRVLWRFGMGSGYMVEQTTFARKLRRVLNEEEIDILHVQDPLVALSVQKAQRRGLVRTRTILGHGTEEPNEFLERLDYVQHLAPWRLEQARDEGCYKPTWTAIPNFIDTELFRPNGPNLREELGIRDETLVVLCVAAIKRDHKRIDYLLEEFAAFAEGRDACLVVAGGKQEETDELVRMGKDRLGDRVRFLVQFPRDRMSDLYRTADLFTLTSLNEMMPIALIEAASSGLPCVTHHHPVMMWMTGPGGVAADMNQRGALVESLEGLANNPDRRERQQDAARLHAIDNFSHDKVTEQILRYYDAVLASEP